jgi:predicted SprT family Zn-dependent metalloprotease
MNDSTCGKLVGTRRCGLKPKHSGGHGKFAPAAPPVSYDTKAAPTSSQFAAYEAAFGYFNRALFDDALPPVLLNFSRHAKAAGFFAPDRWSRAVDGAKFPLAAGVVAKAPRLHEISLNPELLERPPRETLATLVHEMAHHWQHTHGKVSRAGYHNTEWAEKMRTLGLEPVSLDGKNGTGQRVTHTIIEGGAYARAFAAIPAELLFPWQCSPESKKERKEKKKADKVKYTCPQCETNVWGKAGLVNLGCTDCGVAFEEQ